MRSGMTEHSRVTEVQRNKTLVPLGDSNVSIDQLSKMALIKHSLMLKAVERRRFNYFSAQ
jgi:hypothetical protein